MAIVEKRAEARQMPQVRLIRRQFRRYSFQRRVVRDAVAYVVEREEERGAGEQDRGVEERKPPKRSPPPRSPGAAVILAASAGAR